MEYNRSHDLGYLLCWLWQVWSIESQSSDGKKALKLQKEGLCLGMMLDTQPKTPQT